MNTAFLCLGGNIGNRTTYINTSKKLLKQSSITILRESSIYETEAWGSLSEKKYLNQVIKINTNLSVEAQNHHSFTFSLITPLICHSPFIHSHWSVSG
jgi:2-amino-4-hydroxy-6-hydroxymethyldihydropteridine diphosphokinase